MCQSEIVELEEALALIVVEVDTVAVALDGDVTERLTPACAATFRSISTVAGMNQRVNFLLGGFVMPSKISGLDGMSYWAVTLALL